MMDQVGVFKASVCAVAASVVALVCAQENAQPAAAEQAAAAAATAQAPAAEPQQAAKLFEPLVRVMSVQGACEVKRPDAGAFEHAQNNKAYPLGTVIRTGLGGSAILVFSAQESTLLSDDSEALVTASEKNPAGRVVRLIAGKLKTTLRDNLPEGSFGIETPNTRCLNVAGRGEYTLTADATVETFQIATITGAARIEGAQYQIPALRAANTVNIQTALDRSLSRLTSVSGDFAIILENGTESPVSFGMSPKAVVKIWRENAPVGGRAIISTLVVSPTGVPRHHFAYAEGRPDLATRELIAPSEGDEKDKEDALPVLLSPGNKKADAPAAQGTEPAAAKAEKKDAAQ